jgi:hypothetical protein
MHLAQEPQAQGKAAAQALDAVRHGGYAPAHFAGVIERDAGLLVDLVEHQVGQ